MTGIVEELEPQAADVGAADADPELSFGTLSVAGALLALPVAALREVVPCPAQLAPLPLPAPGLVGAVSLRGAVVPVLDLAAVLGLRMRVEHDEDAGERSARVVVILQQGGQVLGLRADAVNGMVRLRASQLQALAMRTPCSEPGLATHSFEHEDRSYTLLAAERLAALPGVPMVAGQLAAGGPARGTRAEPVLLFRCGALQLGVPAMCVDATAPATALLPSALRTDLCRGVIEQLGFEIPVVDTLRLLGLGSVDDSERVSVLILRFPQGRLGLIIDEVRDIVRPTQAEVMPLPPLAMPNEALFSGVLTDSVGAHPLLLNAQALTAHPLLVTLAGLSRARAPALAKGAPPAKGTGAAADATSAASTAGSSSTAVGSRADCRAYLTYDIGVETASPLLQVAEILPYPHTATRLQHRNGAVQGLFSHRGAAVTLVCLSTALGEPAALNAALARVLLVRDEGVHLGFVVQGLRSIEQAHWERPADPNSRKSMALIEVGHAENRRTLPQLDLLQLGRKLLAAAAAA